jgi:hypothetical protein
MYPGEEVEANSGYPSPGLKQENKSEKEGKK